jgi:hypothetical protein
MLLLYLIYLFDSQGRQTSIKLDMIIPVRLPLFTYLV